MPWKESSAMSQRVEFVEEALKENAKIRGLCRDYGISPRTGYKWIRRYKEQGESGLYERSRRPRHSPGKSNPQVEAAVLQVRSKHPSWGGRKIRWQLLQENI